MISVTWFTAAVFAYSSGIAIRAAVPSAYLIYFFTWLPVDMAVRTSKGETERSIERNSDQALDVSFFKHVRCGNSSLRFYWRSRFSCLGSVPFALELLPMSLWCLQAVRLASSLVPVSSAFVKWCEITLSLHWTASQMGINAKCILTHPKMQPFSCPTTKQAHSTFFHYPLWPR